MKLKNIVFIMLGAALYSFGLVNFNMENELGEGGITGVTLILYFVFSLDPALMNIILNIISICIFQARPCFCSGSCLQKDYGNGNRNMCTRNRFRKAELMKSLQEQSVL